jgi:hypothetical protein
MPAGAPSYLIFRLGSSGIGLRSKDRRAARQQLLWRATVIAFSLSQPPRQCWSAKRVKRNPSEVQFTCLTDVFTAFFARALPPAMPCAPA